MDDKQSGSPPDTQSPAPKAAAPASADKKSPREWALATGNGPQKATDTQWFGEAAAGMSRAMGSVEHEVAKKLHGWEEHEHHEDAPILLTREDYLAALAATHPEDEYELDGKGEPKRDQWGNPLIKKHAGNPVPHPAALSPHKGGRVRVRLVRGKQVTEVEKSE